METKKLRLVSQQTFLDFDVLQPYTTKFNFFKSLFFEDLYIPDFPIDSFFCFGLDSSAGVPGEAVGELAATVSALVGNELNISTGVGENSESKGIMNSLLTDYKKDQVMSSGQAQRLLKWSPKFDNVDDIVRNSMKKF